MSQARCTQLMGLKCWRVGHPKPQTRLLPRLYSVPYRPYTFFVGGRRGGGWAAVFLNVRMGRPRRLDRVAQRAAVAAAADGGSMASRGLRESYDDGVWLAG